MPSKGTKILEFYQYQEYDKVSLIIHTDLECSIEANDGCKNNPENSSTTKFIIPSCFSVPAISSCKSIESKHDVYRGKDCMKKFANP